MGIQPLERIEKEIASSCEVGSGGGAPAGGMYVCMHPLRIIEKSENPGDVCMHVHTYIHTPPPP